MKLKDVLNTIDNEDNVVVNCIQNYIAPAKVGNFIVICKGSGLTNRQLNFDVKRIYSYNNQLNVDI